MAWKHRPETSSFAHSLTHDNMSPKVIIVTGASRGIGLAIATYLLAQSCRIVVVSRSAEPLERLRSAHASQVEILAGDLADLSLGQKAVDAAVKRWGGVDGLVVNHGRLEPVERIADADLDGWRAAFDVNYFSAVAVVRNEFCAVRCAAAREGNVRGAKV